MVSRPRLALVIVLGVVIAVVVPIAGLAHLNADGSAPVPIVLTDNTTAELTPTYSRDGRRIVFHRATPPFGAQPSLWRPR